MSNICKTVTLRTRKIKNGEQLSFYLDYYPGYRDESTMKATIKREQCQTRLNIAEREWVRPKVKVQRHESLGIYIFAKQERSIRSQRRQEKDRHNGRPIIYNKDREPRPRRSARLHALAFVIPISISLVKHH